MLRAKSAHYINTNSVCLRLTDTSVKLTNGAHVLKRSVCLKLLSSFVTEKLLQCYSLYIIWILGLEEKLILSL